MSESAEAIAALEARIAELESHQWTANGRLRQDTAGLTHDVGVAVLILVMMWTHIDFHWWYAVVAAAIFPFSRSYAVDRAWNQEQVRGGVLR